MATKTQFKFEGGQALKAALDQLSKAVSAKVQREALARAAVPIQRAAVANAPRGPGPGPHLADNIGIGFQRGEDARDRQVAVGPEWRPDNVFWGYFQEFGTVKQAARPFMRPAFDQASPQSLALLKQILWEEIKKRIPRDTSGRRVGL